MPWHPTLGDVDSAQALADYQAAKRVHKKEWSKRQAAGACSAPGRQSSRRRRGAVNATGPAGVSGRWSPASG